MKRGWSGKKWTGYFSTNFRGPVLASVARPETVREVLENQPAPFSFLRRELRKPQGGRYGRDGP